jgi:hypothetical protein
MFSYATVFNQDLSDWNVSEGIDFVSDNQALQLFQFNILSQPNHAFHYFSC